MKSDFRKTIKEKVLVCDGAMGTLLQQIGPDKLQAVRCPDEVNLRFPELIREVYSRYVKAGADIIETNTFGANRLKLAEFSLETEVDTINSTSVKIARDVIGNNGYVAGSVGPLPDTVKPMGKLTFDETKNIFSEQIKYLVEAGADLILLETFSYIKELKAAVIAAKECDIPVQAHMTFEGAKRTLSGTTPEAFAVIMEGLGVDVIGTNCGAGPDEMLSVLNAMKNVVSTPLSVMPNAGLPVVESGKTVFKASPESFRAFSTTAHKEGAVIIGGCCGTSPEFIRTIAGEVAGKTPVKREAVPSLKLASNTKVIRYRKNDFPLVIGERINPTARKALSQELAEGKLQIVKQDTLSQTAHGADLLDVNVSIGDPQEALLMNRVMTYVQKMTDCPVVIDTVNPETLEAALKTCEGRPLINSVNAEEKSLRIVLPLAKKYGAAVIALPISEKGIPVTSSERIKLIDTLLQQVLDEGLKKEDVLFDCLMMAVSSSEGDPEETVKTLAELNRRGLYTVLGVSNISYGMPGRSIINSAFLSVAVHAGLDAAIINPNNERIIETLYGAALISDRDRNSVKYLARIGEQAGKNSVVRKKTQERTIEEKLTDAVLLGDRENVVSLVKEALLKDLSALDIGLKILTPALEEVGARYSRKEYFLPQLIMAAETMQEASLYLEKELEKNKESFTEAGRIVLATVEGDVHDIGKNIVKTVLKNYGYRIVDLGKNVRAETIIKEAKKHNADIIGLSALMTTTMVKIKEVVEIIEKSNLPFKTIIGGAVITQKYADEVGADGYGRDAVHAVEVIKRLMSTKKKK